MTYKLYDVLGLSRGASEQEIKKAYKIKAMQYHPDKNKGDQEAEKKFKEISNAYDILSDDNKKAHYDRVGDEGYNNEKGNPRGHPGRDDIFEHFFGGRGPSGMFGGFHFDNFNEETRKCSDIQKTCNVTLDEVFNGINKNFNISLTKHCHECIKTCENCNGLGIVKQVKHMGVFTQVFNSTCDMCNNGFVNKINNSCMKCKGKCKYVQDMNAKLQLPKGIANGFKTCFRDMGEQPKTPNQKSGDLIFVVNILDHPHFTRDGNNLHYKCDLTFIESIVGKQIEIPYFNNEKISINTNSWGVVYPGKKYMINNKGMPIVNTPSFGNMFVEFNINYPTKIKNNEKINELKFILNDIFY